ncbi:MAG: acetylglucosamine-6-sulfatase, partial [Rubripirellula sp.]
MTRSWKYTYWWYGDSEIEPTEELFHLDDDPLEMVNLAASSGAEGALATMRAKYDDELAKWKDQVVPYNNYTHYGTLFDRDIPWQQKITQKKSRNRE